jgi:hypothetical protein
MIQFLKDSIRNFIKDLLPFFVYIFFLMSVAIMIFSTGFAFYAVYIFDIKLLLLTIVISVSSFLFASLLYGLFL